MRRRHDFVQFHHDAFGRDYLYARGVAPDGLEGVVGNAEPQLAGEADGSHHAQGVVAEGDVGVQGGAEDAFVHVADAPEGVHELPVAVGVQAYRKGVDGEVPAALVVLQGAVLHDGLAAVSTVALAAAMVRGVLEAGGAEVLEDRDLAAAEGFRRGFGQLNADGGRCGLCG